MTFLSPRIQTSHIRHQLTLSRIVRFASFFTILFSSFLAHRSLSLVFDPEPVQQGSKIIHEPFKMRCQHFHSLPALLFTPKVLNHPITFLPTLFSIFSIDVTIGIVPASPELIELLSRSLSRAQARPSFLLCSLLFLTVLLYY